MSRLPRALASIGAAAAALVLVAPTAALADQSDHGKGGNHGNGDRSGSANQDPAGNNGTIKIEPYGVTDGHANHPHPGCDFRLQMFGFDTNQTGTITFVGQAPTKGAVTAQPLPGHQLLSNDAAGGGQDVDEHYDVTAASLGLTGTPAKQGWHIKVLVNADNAPGGAKQKVFWLSCPATSAPATTTTSPTESTSTTTSGGGTGGTAVTTSGLGGGTAVTAPATSTTTSATTVSGQSAGAATVLGRRSAAFTGGGGSAVVTAPAGAASSAGTQGSGGALPFTGLALGSLLAFALGSVGVGALAIRAGRRRTALR